MRVRIVVADECEARFYDATDLSGELHPAGRMSDGRMQRATRAFKVDVDGAVSDAVPGFRCHPDVAHDDHGRRQQAAAQFAHQIAGRLEDALRHDCFDRLVVIAGRPFLGALRRELSDRVRAAVAAEVPKDLIHQPAGAVSVYVPKTAFEAPVLKRRVGATA
jgi:protein required for attachment to host cells